MDHRPYLKWVLPYCYADHNCSICLLQPFRMVKDLRTNFEAADPDSVLDGDIDLSALLDRKDGA
jgi:hypothetical protein